MKAVVCREAQLELTELPSAQPERGQVRLKVLRCGICGSDLHARRHCDDLADVLAEVGYSDFTRSSQRVVFGHEFCGEIAEFGPAAARASPPARMWRRCR